MPRKSIFDMPFSAVYKALMNKAEKKGRTKAEVDEITCWLTGYSGLEELDGKTWKSLTARRMVSSLRRRPHGIHVLSLSPARSAACRWRRSKIR